MCRAQQFGRYPEGKCHSMTLQHNRVRPINSLIEIGFSKLFHRNDNIFRRCVMLNYLGRRYFEDQAHSMTLKSEFKTISHK